jgi:hypothetical protein
MSPFARNQKKKCVIVYISVKYKHPAAFFNPNVRLSTLIQALEYNISPHTLDVPEGCHIHPSVEV